MPLKNWTEAQSHIHSLYIAQHQTLRRVKDLMLRTYGFDASIRAYRDKLKEWGYLRRESRQHDLQLQLPTSGVMDGHADAALPSIQSTVGIFGGLPDFNFPHSVPSPSESQGLWPNSSLHGSVTLGQFGQGTTSFASMPNSDASTYSLLPGNNNGNNLNTRDSSGRTILHQAVISRNLKDVEKYLSMGLAIDTQDDENNQPLHHAAKGGFQEIVKLLLKYKADTNARGKSGRTPLHMSVRFPKVMKEILKAYPAISSQDDNGDTPLHLALSSSSLDERPKGSAIQQLVSAYANVNALNTAQTTPFHMMLGKIDSKGKYHTEFVVMFLENNADISLQTSDGKPPFDIFLEKIGSRWYSHDRETLSGERNLDLKMFIAMKANTEIMLSSGRTFLTEALRNYIEHPWKDFELGQLLCDTADVNEPDSNGNSPLHWIATNICYKNEERILKYTKVLLLRGANPNSANKKGKSPLLQCLLLSNLGVAVVAFTKLLLESGANPMMRDSEGNLPIYYVAKSTTGKEQAQLMQTLLEESVKDQWEARMTWFGSGRGPKDEKWWKEYKRFYQQQNWSDPAHLLDLANLMPKDVSDAISSTALMLVATKFLQSAKTNFDSLKAMLGPQHQDTQAQSYKIRTILRDCLNLKIEVDQSWYHSLLDLFD